MSIDVSKVNGIFGSTDFKATKGSRVGRGGIAMSWMVWPLFMIGNGLLRLI